MASPFSTEAFMAVMTAAMFCLASPHQQSVQNMCKFTSANYLCTTSSFPDSCRNSLANVSIRHVAGPHQLQAIFDRSIHTSLTAVSKASLYFSDGSIEKLVDNIPDNGKLSIISSLDTCATLLSLAFDHIDDSLSVSVRSREARGDVRTWLSAATTDIETCIDRFDEFSYEVKRVVIDILNSSMKYLSTSLAIVTSIDSCLGSIEVGSDKPGTGPYWIGDMRHVFEVNTTKMRIDLVVAKDGSGNYRTIGEAVEAVPNHSPHRFVIFVEKGIYYENVIIGKSKWNVVMMGDGSSETIVSGNLSNAGGIKTFKTATFAVFGRGFVARHMAFMNTAPSSQAVALLSTSDRSVFFKCLIDGKQDTLYMHSNRQFYRECIIRGTVDFIFGNSAAVIQSSLIQPKNPSPGRTNVITAQGRSGPNQKTGLSMHNCTIRAGEDLDGVRTFLGRPWRDYSTVVILQTEMDGSVDPEGWRAWDGSGPAAGPSTVFYGEYGNSGVGAETSGRVRWSGVRVGLGVEEAKKFTVGELVDGGGWLPETGVPFEVGLLEEKGLETSA